MIEKHLFTARLLSLMTAVSIVTFGALVETYKLLM